MTTTVKLDTNAPGAYKALIALSNEVSDAAIAAGLDPLLIELVKIRTSQLNGCAFCLRMHTQDALAKGETPDRLAVLPAWRETAYFTPDEAAALSIAENATLIAAPAVQVESIARIGELSATQTGAVQWLAIVMNAFNRVAVLSHYDVSP